MQDIDGAGEYLLSVAEIIRAQIGFWNLAACGARKFGIMDAVSGQFVGGLHMEVGIMPGRRHCVRVMLGIDDEYRVFLYRIMPSGRLAEINSVMAMADTVGSVVYHLCNQSENYDPYNEDFRPGLFGGDVVSDARWLPQMIEVESDEEFWDIMSGQAPKEGGE